MPDVSPSLAESLLARRLARNDGWLDAADSWDREPANLRKDYLTIAREALAAAGGPTQDLQQAAAVDAEVRELTRQRDRYREAWIAACARARKARQS